MTPFRYPTPSFGPAPDSPPAEVPDEGVEASEPQAHDAAANPPEQPGAPEPPPAP
jgi:hypothetical protein